MIQIIYSILIQSGPVVLTLLQLINRTIYLLVLQIGEGIVQQCHFRIIIYS